uniref:Si:dkey-16p21.8 n=1 Tax=Paramormyrops kingsleyae TaxID=1676925 RepID=A0A3B3Q5I9_9TELE
AGSTDAPVPAACHTIKADLDKSVKEKGTEGCKDLLEAFHSCMKSTTQAP